MKNIEHQQNIDRQFSVHAPIKGYVVYARDSLGEWNLYCASYGHTWAYKGFAVNCANKMVSHYGCYPECVVVDMATNKIVYQVTKSFVAPQGNINMTHSTQF